MTHHYGILALLPILLVVVLAIFTKLSLEPLILGCLFGCALIIFPSLSSPNPFNYLLQTVSLFADFVLKAFQNETYLYIVIVCCLYGALIELIVKSGAIKSFEKKILNITQSPQKILVITWIFGTILFIDDFLSALMNGSVMRKITDKLNISREMLAFVVSSTAVPIAVITPVSTWTIFLGKLLEENNLAQTHQGLAQYLKVIPYVLYAWTQYLLIPLVIFKIIPVFGPMKKAQYRTQQTGQTIPPNSDNFITHAQEFDPKKNHPVWILFLPIALAIAFTILFDFDALKGVFLALFITAFIFVAKKVCHFSQIANAFIEGSKTMLYGLILLLLSFVIKEVGDHMGLTQYVITLIAQHIHKAYLPTLIFLALGIIAFATGNSFGLYAIAIPMVLPIAHTLNVNPYLCVGAVVSAGAFGAHACFYSDGTIMAAYGTECNSYAHALTQLPYALISFTISLAFYLLMGWIN